MVFYSQLVLLLNNHIFPMYHLPDSLTGRYCEFQLVVSFSSSFVFKFIDDTDFFMHPLCFIFYPLYLTYVVFIKERHMF